MKKGFIIFFVSVSTVCFAQNKPIDSLKLLLSSSENDTSRVLVMSDLSYAYTSMNSDSAIAIAHRAVELAQQINFPRGEARALVSLCMGFDTRGDLAEALEQDFHALAIAEENKLPLEKSMSLSTIGDIYWDMNDYPEAIRFLQQGALIVTKVKDQPEAAGYAIQIELDLGAVFMLNNQLDSAYVHLQRIYKKISPDDFRYPEAKMFAGNLLFRMGKKNEGLEDLRQSIHLFQATDNHYSLGDACRFISECFRKMNMIDSSIFYAKKGLAEAQSIGYKSPLLYNSKMLAELYEPIDISKALYYRKVYDTANNTYYGPDKVRSLQKTLAEEQERQRQKEIDRVAYNNRIKEYAFLSGLAIMFIIAFLLYRNNRHKQKANKLLASQKQKIESTLQELKSTQSQLIQSEKMASLGELTAGIAHEIQNPLNFVNNFSEVNTELAEELKAELAVGNSQLAAEIANDIKENSEKINHHGKRADAIVKGMLQHSRQSIGVKEPTDINKLADEYLRLAYRGFRTKEKDFYAKLETDFDQSIGKMNIVPQDIGRILLNLYNNAFYAVNEKRKQLAAQEVTPFEKVSPLGRYEPTITVSTKKSGNQVLMTVSDNGNGIPKNIVDKIFQPFFTTKPTGQGTGLGLSLSYDIIKAHGGEIKVETKEGEGTTFSILFSNNIIL